MRSIFSLSVMALFCMVLSSGCATIIKGSSQEVSFQSQPEGATVTVSGKVLGKTPLTTTIDRKSNQILVFSKDGYKEQTMQMATTLNPWFFGNILIGGLLGSSTDGISGAVHEYSPSQYFITLPPLNLSASDKSVQNKTRIKEFVIMSYSNLLKELAVGEGEYLASLLNLLDVKQEQKSATITKIKALSEIYKDIPSFADRVLDLYGPEPLKQGSAS